MKRSAEAPYSGFCCASASLAWIAVTRGDVSDGGDDGLAVLRRCGGGDRGREPRFPNELGWRSLPFIRDGEGPESSSENDVPRPGYWIVPSSGATNLTCNHVTSTVYLSYSIAYSLNAIAEEAL